ncbi:Glycine cleavage system transcriptional activator [compost metagenome]
MTPADLAEQVLLDEENTENWQLWLARAGVPDLTPRKRMSIDDTNVRLHATIDGQGFSLTCPTLLQRELQEGILIAPFTTVLPHYSYYLLYKPDVLANPKAKTFIDWLLAQLSPG